MRRALAVLAAVCVLYPAALASAHIQDQLTVIPAEPIEGDEITIIGGGWMPDGCWSAEYTYDCAVDGNDVTLTFHTIDNWMPGFACITIVLDLVGSCDLGALPQGTYSVRVIEMRQSLRQPDPSIQDFEFVVQKAVANEVPSWSMLKGRYGAESD